MKVTIEIVVATVAVVVVLFVLLGRRRKVGGAPTTRSRTFRGPPDMNFTCAGCSVQVTHTKRTVAAWEKGSRRIFCDACHKKWRNAQPPQEAPTRASSTATPRRALPSAGTTSRARAPAYASESKASKAPGGCLGVVLVMLLVPIAVVFLTTNT